MAGIAASVGEAAAVVPINAPGIVVGGGFNHEETIALSNSPIPSILGVQLLAGATAVHVDPRSAIPQKDGMINADMPTIFRDAAAASNGKIVLALVDPAQWRGKHILVAEFL
ncbi:hypothetical protein AB0C34_17955 [Nocardia sp. NPDC049220]|uniref:hypothetical protein n=1 Tax=Nocardia sp. NPDC049220 TaxID=3155273 RepID=UPI0033CD6162